MALLSRPNVKPLKNQVMDYLYENPEWDGRLDQDKTYLAETGSSFVLSFKLTGSMIDFIYHSGDCTDSVKEATGWEQIKEQADAISDKDLDGWWDEFFCDDTPEQHANSTRERKIAWAIFDAAANAVDGYCIELPETESVLPPWWDRE